MRFSRSCFGVFLLWLFIFSFLGVIFNLIRTNEKEQNKIVLAEEIKIQQPIVKDKPSLTVNGDLDLSSIIHSETKPNSKFAYVTLMHGIDESFGYRGFLYNALLAKQSLKTLGSTADFIVLIGFKNGVNPNNQLINKDLQLLRDYDIILYFLPRLPSEDDISSDGKTYKVKEVVGFMEMALLKITPFNFLQYEAIQFFDGDVLPYKNMDCLFSLGINSYNTGNASPLNSGWYLGIPNVDDYKGMKALAIKRLTSKWDVKKGWGTEIPAKLYYRGSNREVKKWDFNGASLDQGLMTHYFILTNGRAQLLDIKNARVYQKGYLHTVEPLSDVLNVCAREGGEKSPQDMFYHYTGHNKPWMQDLRKPKDKSLALWAALLDSLHLSVNSSTINDHNLKAPLGFFAKNE